MSQPWDLSLLWKFLRFRLKSCKPSTIISEMSALAHFGAHSGYLLATSRHDADSVMYRRICDMRAQLTIDYKQVNDAPGPDGPDQSCPLGFRVVEMILSALGVFSFRSFAAHSRYTRHHIIGSALQHSAGMRFGHFAARMYTIASFHWSARDRAFILLTDWHRYSGLRRYTLSFPLRPMRRPLRYAVRATDGTHLAFLSAAQLLFWHFSLLCSAGETVVFAPIAPAVAPERGDRQRWLRSILLAAIPLSQRAARRLVSAVTPHSFRPGLAGDLLLAGESFDVILRLLRWMSKRVARMYAERPALCSFMDVWQFRSVKQVGVDYVAR
jgi:hypothetical protein